MNIFKLGLILSVLLFNLSCAIIPDENEFNTAENTENIYEIDELDLNVQDQSFIQLEPFTDSNIDVLVSYLSHHGIYNEASIAQLDEIPQELRFTPEQLDEIEVSINEFDTSSLQKKFLYSFVSFLRTD